MNIKKRLAVILPYLFIALYATKLGEAWRLAEGMDAARKILLACAVAFSKLPVEGVDCEGIENISAGDVEDCCWAGQLRP